MYPCRKSVSGAPALSPNYPSLLLSWHVLLISFPWPPGPFACSESPRGKRAVSGHCVRGNCQAESFAFCQWGFRRQNLARTAHLYLMPGRRLSCVPGPDDLPMGGYVLQEQSPRFRVRDLAGSCLQQVVGRGQDLPGTEVLPCAQDTVASQANAKRFLRAIVGYVE